MFCAVMRPNGSCYHFDLLEMNFSFTVGSCFQDCCGPGFNDQGVHLYPQPPSAACV